MQKANVSPKVSVILTTYNRAEKLLPRAIKSVLEQTLRDFELIIVDDASTDGTVDLVRKLMRSDKRIRLLTHNKNFGSDTRGKNEGILASKGQFLAYLDDDCEFLPYHLEKLVEKLEANPKLDLVWCDMWILDDTRPEWPGEQGITFDFDGQFLLNRCYIDTSEVVHRRHLAFAVGGWDESLPKFVDWNFWVRIMKWGANMQRIPIIATNHYFHKSTLSPRKSERIKSKSWIDPQTGMNMFDPTWFKPASCLIHQDWLYHLAGENKEAAGWREKEMLPKVAVFTLTYDRLDYTKRMWKSLNQSTKYPFDWFVWDNGSKDGTAAWVMDHVEWMWVNETNAGISKASNGLLDKIAEGNYQIIMKVDNDCEFLTKGWLEDFIKLWQMNHLLYMAPYPEGLVDNPGGAPRVGYSTIGTTFVEVAYHLSGICTFIDARAYKDFRWSDQFLHGNQDREASIAFSKMRYMPCHVPFHRIWHMDTTAGQHKKYPDYFLRRVKEKRATL